MTIILACVAYAMVSSSPYTLTLDTMTLEYPPRTPSYGTTERVNAQQSCTAHKTVKEAALSAYRKDTLDSSLQLYRVDTDSLKVEKVPTPTVRIVVEGQK